MTMYNYEHCTEYEKMLLSSTPYYFLTKEEQANFHFMMHMRCSLRSPDFMESFEKKLHRKKFEKVKSEFPRFDEIDPASTFIKFKEYDLSDMSAEQFQAMINDPHQTPIVAKELIKDTKAVKEWTHEYLVNNFHEVEITASNEASGGNDIKKLSLSEIVKSQLDTKAKKSYYINNSSELFNKYPNLIDEVGANIILDLFKGHSVSSFNQMFVGNLNTWGTNWHMGNDISCAMMITGKKKWYFLEPRLAYVLKPMLDGANGMLTKTDGREQIDDARA